MNKRILAYGDKRILGVKQSGSFADIFINDMVQIEPHCSCTFALCKDGKLYKRGTSSLLEPINCFWKHIPLSFQVVQISCKNHILVLMDSHGQVYRNGYGFFLFPIADKWNEEDLIPCLPSNKKAKRIITGWWNACIIYCENNELYLYGNSNSTGILAHHDSWTSSPTCMNFFVDKAPIEDIQMGDGHTVFLLQTGQVYTMGANQCCGKISNNHFWSPTFLDFKEPIRSIYCGSVWTVIQTESKKWYAFGQERGSVPNYGRNMTIIPQCIDDLFPQSIQVKKIVSTRERFFILSQNGDLYSVKNVLSIDLNFKGWKHLKSNVVDMKSGILTLVVFESNKTIYSQFQSHLSDVQIFV